MYYIGIKKKHWVAYRTIGGPIPTMHEAKNEFLRFRQGFSIGFASGDEIKCEMNINGDECLVAILGAFATPINYIDFEEV
jgi:hypothetical protein